MLKRVTVGALVGAAVAALTACSASLQTVSGLPETGEKRLSVGAVQREIRKGMTTTAVVEALGSPNIVTTDEQGREVWVYDRFATERAVVDESGYAGLVLLGYARQAGSAATSQRTLTVIVKFDADGRVRDYAYHASRF